MSTICGADCTVCALKATCKGCAETCGKPFGGSCLAAQYIQAGGEESFEAFKNRIMAELNGLGVEGMPEITQLYCLPGFFINLEYSTPGGKVKLLDDTCIYLGAQVEPTFAMGEGAERCYGIAAGLDFLLVSEYGRDGTDPEIVVYRRR